MYLLLLCFEAEHTEILHILIPDDSHWAALTLPAFGTSTVTLKHHDAVGSSRSDKGSAVAVAGPSGGRVEGDVAQAVAECAEQEGDMAAEPCELQSADTIIVSIASAWGVCTISYV